MPTSHIHHEERGQGQAVVLVHGFPLDRRIFAAQLESLSANHRLITVDLPGFGKSAAMGPFSMQSLADAVHEHLKSIGALPCVLGGLSMGGYVALPFARTYAADLRGLTLIDTRAEADTAEGKTNRDRMIESARKHGVGAIVDAMFPKLMTEANVRADPALGARLREIMQSQNVEVLCNALAAMRDREDFIPILPQIKTPTLIIVGAHDAITPLDFAQRMHDGLPRSWLATIEGSGHIPTMEKPQRSNEAIARFLREI